MQLVSKVRNVCRGLIQSYGSEAAKKRLWDLEFSSGQWSHIENTGGDFLYAPLVKYTKGGTILDMGCGSGNTGAEIDQDAYSAYTGVDISDVAIAHASRRAQEQGRTAKNCYAQGDIMSYVPNKSFDVILFRESLYYVPIPKIPATLERYARYLNPQGVIVVRMYNEANKQSQAIVSIARSNFTVIEHISDSSAAGVIVFRRLSQQPSTA